MATRVLLLIATIAVTCSFCKGTTIGNRRRDGIGSPLLSSSFDAESGLPPPPPPPPEPPKPAPEYEKCGWTSVPQGRVIGGEDANPGAWPWQIALYEWDEFKCGGTLIHPQWILTAQHCMASYYDEDAYHVVLGDHNRDYAEGPEVKVAVEKIVKHPGYHVGGYYNNDVALLKLKAPVIFNSRVFPACLPTLKKAVKAGAKCFISGWGRIKNGGDVHPVLQQAQLPVVDSSECKMRLEKSFGGHLMNLTEQMVCAGERHANSVLSGCQGDSGGPFVCQASNHKWYLQGVVSWGSPRCDVQDRYTVFAKVAKFRSWIKEQITTN